MNKKTLGKIAALGLAGLTVIPSFGLVASANVTITDKQDTAGKTILTGIAYKVSWSMEKTTHTYVVLANGTIMDTPVHETGIENPAAFNLDGFNAKSVTYYQYQTNGASIPTFVNNAVASANDVHKQLYKEWEDYAFYYYHTSGTGKETTGTRTVNGETYYYRHDSHADAGVYGWFKRTTTDDPACDSGYTAASYPVTSEPVGDCITYRFIENPSNTQISLSALASESGKYYVDIANNILTPDNDGDYTLNGTPTETPSTGTGTTTTTTTTGLPASAYRTSSDIAYRSTKTNYYYPNLAALRNVEGSNAGYTTSTVAIPYSSTNCFFDPILGHYTSANTTGYAYVVSRGTSSEDSAVYKVNGYYYPTYTSAYNVAGGNTALIQYISDYTSLPSNYFSQVTGSFYSTYDAALTASGNNASRVTVFNGASTSNMYDPYYYYFLNKGNGSTSTSKDTTSATLGNKKGWTSIANYLNKASSGSSATIAMNNETTVPSTVLSAIKGKNVTVKFVLDNGASFTVNGKDVTSAKNVDIDVTYNTKSISKKLIQTAYNKNDAVSSAQLSIDSSSLGFNSDLTVKFNSKRAGYKAKIYRYNASRNSLVLVDTATVGSNGKTTFDNISKGGEFVVVLYK